MGREGGAQETELAPATGTGPWLTKVRKTIDGTLESFGSEHEKFRVRACSHTTVSPYASGCQNLGERSQRGTVGINKTEGDTWDRPKAREIIE